MRTAAFLALISLLAVHCAPLSPESIVTDEADANRGAVKSSDGNAYLNPWLKAPSDMVKMPVTACILVEGLGPNAPFTTPDGKEHRADANGRVFRDNCTPEGQPDNDDTFVPGFVQAANPGNDGDDAPFPPSPSDAFPADGSNGPNDDGFGNDTPFPFDEAEGDNADHPCLLNDSDTPTPSTNGPTSPSFDGQALPAESAPTNGDDDEDEDDGLFPSNGRVAAAVPTSGSDDASEPASDSFSLPIPSGSMPGSPPQLIPGADSRIRPSGMPSPSLDTLSTPNAGVGISAGAEASADGCADCNDC